MGLHSKTISLLFFWLKVIDAASTKVVFLHCVKSSFTVLPVSCNATFLAIITVVYCENFATAITVSPINCCSLLVVWQLIYLFSREYLHKDNKNEIGHSHSVKYETNSLFTNKSKYTVWNIKCSTISVKYESIIILRCISKPLIGYWKQLLIAT